FTWSQNVDGDFDDPARWHDQNGHNGVPGPGDWANIPGAGFTVTSSADNTVSSLNSNARITLTGGTFSVGDPIIDSSLDQLVIDSVANFHVTSGRTFLTNGGESLGRFIVEAGAQLFLTGGTHHVDSGTSLEGAGAYHVSSRNFSSGTLSIDVDADTRANLFLD